MQTFLPSPNFLESSQILDYRRLGKQRLEAQQLIKALLHGGGWANHPAARMWTGYIPALCVYGMSVCNEWVNRGYNDNLFDWFQGQLADRAVEAPRWLGDDNFHASHRSNLLRKDPVFYGKYGWVEGPDLPYMWPISDRSRK